MPGVTVVMVVVILSRKCRISRIISAYTMFLIYPPKRKSIGVRSELLGGQKFGPNLPIQALRKFY
jgi:hypothetical protein